MNERTISPVLPVKTLQIIVLAMAAGIVGLTGVGIALGPVGGESQIQSSVGIFYWVCGALIVSGAVMGWVLRSIALKKLASQPEENFERRAAAIYTGTTIVSAAAAEGPALLGGIIVLLFTGPGVAILFVAVPLALLILQFPTMGRWESFLYKAKAARNR